MGISKDTLSNLEQMLDLIESASEGTAIDLGEVSCEALIHRNIFAISPVSAWMLLSARSRRIPGLSSFRNQLHLGKLTYLLAGQLSLVLHDHSAMPTLFLIMVKQCMSAI